MGMRANALRAVSGKAWGANTSISGQFTWPISGRVPTMPLPTGWMPGVAPANLEHLKVAQRRACRIITDAEVHTNGGS